MIPWAANVLFDVYIQVRLRIYFGICGGKSVLKINKVLLSQE